MNTGPAGKKGNRYDRMEWGGAFGDLGTLIPFVVGYITILNMDPRGVLFVFGAFLVFCGLYYRTPMPVQPMKAIAGAAITGAGAVTSGMVLGAGLFTGFFWLLAGFTGVVNYIARVVTRPVLGGIVLALGLLFMRDGIKMMQDNFIIAAAALLAALLLFNNRKIPVMFLLLFAGIGVALFRDPSLAGQLADIKLVFRLPEFSAARLSWSEILMGTLLLGLPQVPLTLGSAIISTSAENNKLFPDRPVTEKKLAVSHGVMNLIAPFFGGVPVCHGAGGLAGHVRFGAGTGGATVIMGSILLLGALFLSDSVALFFKLIPGCILGVILFFAGLELAAGARSAGSEKHEYYVMLVTAGFGMWNMGAGFIAGMIIQEIFRRKLVVM